MAGGVSFCVLVAACGVVTETKETWKGIKTSRADSFPMKTIRPSQWRAATAVIGSAFQSVADANQQGYFLSVVPRYPLCHPATELRGKPCMKVEGGCDDGLQGIDLGRTSVLKGHVPHAVAGGNRSVFQYTVDGCTYLASCGVK